MTRPAYRRPFGTDKLYCYHLPDGARAFVTREQFLTIGRRYLFESEGMALDLGISAEKVRRLAMKMGFQVGAFTL